MLLALKLDWAHRSQLKTVVHVLRIVRRLVAVEANKVVRGDSWWGGFIPGLGAATFEEGCAKRRWADFHDSSPDRKFRVARTVQ